MPREEEKKKGCKTSFSLPATDPLFSSCGFKLSLHSTADPSGQNRLYSCLSESKPYRYFSSARSHTVSLRVSSITERKDPTWQKHGSATQITALICSRDKKINQTLEIPLAATKLVVLRKNKTSYLRPIVSAGREGSRQTARQTSFWLPGAFPSSNPALYTCRLRLKVRGRSGGWAAVTLGNCTHTSHQRVGAAARPDQGKGRQGGRHSGRGKWLTVLRVLAV